ncbi:substrate-binding periplasmic protein [Janthinobacterium fluminis]|uniref:ABC transporter substrate-binding protein n=1 Tax=Janthinobacterium fluminis TaxID=2987524 RepID=A0ABT5JVS1_9BURK|nr:ABC transporter substrate-binding protein [Janthinobacterium fluminis]MDC8756819.1 ABC transporter substrate-binding protein [Janthinobacterium fluminis]
MSWFDRCAGRAGRIAAVALALGCCVPAAAVTLLRTAGQTATEPKFIVAKRGGASHVVGLCVDIMRAVERVDPGLKFVGDQAMQPLIRVEAGVLNGDLDAACGFVRNPQRETQFNFVDTPLFVVKYYLTVRADDDIQINNWDDVRKLGDQGIILLIHGFAITRRLDEIGGLRVDSGANTSALNFQKLLAGRGRFYYHRSPGIKAEIRNAGVIGKVKVLPTNMDTQKFYMVLSKSLPAGTTERVRAAIAQLAKSGELTQLLAKWDEG